eukprot:TRINITY_DN49443_c0_g1_i1.p1 TRINITY_DN49443_c0_g1~~TRINITY_DN49443_c0_g1_i1.p1  ORF type:complete len:309 (+),score=56.09 TRINITY_DN49443_c0_g1_i1:37-963(+)
MRTDMTTTEVCSEHGKKRSMQCLVDDGMGGFRCHVDMRCKTAEDHAGGPSETAVCSVHHKNRSTDVLVDDGYGGLCCMRGKECRVSGPKTVICAFYQEGKCTKGVNCPFSHGDDDDRGDGGYGKDSGKGWGGRPSFVLDERDEEMVNWMEKGIAVLVEKGKGKFGPAFARLASAKGWSGKGFNGYEPERRGGARSFESDGKGKGWGGSGKGGKPGVASEGTFLCALHKKYRSGSSVIDMGDGTYQCKANSECIGGGPGSGPKTKRALCKFFETGSCIKGASCIFAHGEEEIGMPVEVEGGDGSRYSPY